MGNKSFASIVIFFMPLIFTGCTGNRWTGFYYPEGVGGKTIYSQVDQFSSYEECKSWLNDQKLLYGSQDGSDSECGNKCKLSEYYSSLVRSDPEKAMVFGPQYVCDQTL